MGTVAHAIAVSCSSSARQSVPITAKAGKAQKVPSWQVTLTHLRTVKETPPHPGLPCSVSIIIYLAPLYHIPNSMVLKVLDWKR